jgi:parallel beta-helix repeat protein
MTRSLFLALFLTVLLGISTAWATTIYVPANYSTIQAAIDDASDGDVIQVANGTYQQTATLNINKGLSIIGESESGVIIDVTAATSYGIHIQASNVTLQNFTVLPNTTSNDHYCIKANPATLPVIYANLTLDHITINGSRRSAFDIHGYDDVVLSNLTATGTTKGVGLAVAGCHDVDMSYITTSGNAWGGVAVYVSKPQYINRGSDNVNFNFANSTLADGIYVEDEEGLFNTNIHISGYTYGINNKYAPEPDTENIAFYIDGTLADALYLGAGFNAKYNNKMSYVWANANPIENYYVGPGMAIQAAIDAASDGDEINVAAGTYNEAVTINKGVSVLGAGAATTTIDALSDVHQSTVVKINTTSGDVKLDGFTIKNTTDEAIRVYKVVLNQGSVGAQVEISNNNIIGGYDSTTGTYTDWGFGFYSQSACSNLFFHHNNISNCYENAVGLERHRGTSEISYNTISDCAPYPAIWFMTEKRGSEAPEMYEITARQYIHHNTITTGACIGMAAPYGEHYNQYLGGKYTDVEISYNNISNLPANGKGIQLEADGDNGGIYNPVIANNTITGASGLPSTSARGIRILGNVFNADINNNTISGVYRGIWQSYSWGQPGIPGPSGNILRKNSITDCAIGVENQYSSTAAILDAKENWWGDASGPLDDGSLNPGPDAENPDGQGTKVSGYVSYDPWYSDAAMTTLKSNNYTAGCTYSFTVHSPNSEDGARAYIWGYYTNTSNKWASGTFGTGYFSGGYATVNYTVPLDYQKSFYWEVIAYQSPNNPLRTTLRHTAGPWNQFDTYLLDGQTIVMEAYRYEELEMDLETGSYKMMANAAIPTNVDAATIQVLVPWSGDINNYDNSVYNNTSLYNKKGFYPTVATDLGYQVEIVASNPNSPVFQEIRITKPSIGYDVTLFGWRGETTEDPLGYFWNTTFYIAPVQNMVMNYDPATGICSGSFSAPLEYYQQYFIQPRAEIIIDATHKYVYQPGSTDLILNGGMLTPIRNVTTGAYYETIQAAIDAADAGDVIEVQPGTYVEQLHITTENLTVRGVGAEPVVIQSPDVLPLMFGISAVNRPIVFVDGVSSFTLTGVTVDGNCLGNANNRFYGIAFWDAGGTLEDVHVTNIMDNPFSGEQHGIGVYAYNSTPLKNYTINMNRVLIDNFQKDGVFLNGNSESQNLTVNLDYVTIIGEGQTGVTAQNGIDINYCTGTVDNCNVSGIYYTGDYWTAVGLIVANCVDMVLTGNTVTDCLIAIYTKASTGVDLMSNQISGVCDCGIYDHHDYPSTGLVVNQNTITGIPFAMWLPSGSTITNNILTGNEYAIVLSDGTGYTVTGNQLTDNYVHVHNFGAEPDVNTLIPTNTYAPTYFIKDQVIYGKGAVLYVDAPLEVIQDNVQQTYSVKASYAENLRGFTVKLVIPKADFATEPTNFVKESAFTSPLYVVDQSTDKEWIYVVTGSVLGASSVTGENVTFFTFDATSTEDYNNVPDGCYIQLPLEDVILRDEYNQPIECFDTLDKWILIDNIAPTPVVWEDEITALLHPCRTTPDANNSIDLMWTNPEDAKKIQIWTLSYGDAGDGYTSYPEYEDHSEPILTAPDPLLGSPQNGWVKAAEIDPPETFPYTLTGMDRGYYYITLFAMDEVGNISDAPEAPFYRESISYWPGDVNGDGEVKDDDLSSLGAVWGLTSSSDAWNNLIDIGPSTDYARRSRPTPDDKIDIEDLMMLAMNYYNTHYTDYHRNSPELNPVTVTLATQSSGNQVFVNLELSGNNGFLKGLNMPIAYGSGLQLVSVEQGNIWPETSLLLHTNAEGLVEVSCVTLGRNALEGDGNVATLVFNVVGDDTEITPQPMIARSLDNHEITITYDCTANDDLVNVIPLESYLGSNYPNPFNPSTTIQYGLKEAGSVRINVYNSRGQLVRTLVDENKAAGTYRVVWDGKDGRNRSVSSGIYYFRMEAKGCMKTNKGILIK